LNDFTQFPDFSRKSASLKANLTASPMGIIAEIKRKSPSGGDIAPGLNPAALAHYYTAHHCSGISILTDHTYFGGSLSDLQEVRKVTHLPLLRKEFILDELQLFESKAYGADVVLLIAAILEKQQAHHLTIVAKNLGLEVVFEVHTARDLEKLNDEADILAVNNRNLATQHTSLDQSFLLAPFLPAGIPVISASGIQHAEELQLLQQAGYQGALIGESILRRGHLSSLQLHTLPHAD
jgi:indole-3-glycerol phosphate synthase